MGYHRVGYFLLSLVKIGALNMSTDNKSKDNPNHNILVERKLVKAALEVGRLTQNTIQKYSKFDTLYAEDLKNSVEHNNVISKN
jgi:hypothetical protein